LTGYCRVTLGFSFPNFFFNPARFHPQINLSGNAGFFFSYFFFNSIRFQLRIGQVNPSNQTEF
jgi:hypothetical protein